MKGRNFSSVMVLNTIVAVPGGNQTLPYSSKFSWHKNFVKHSKLAKLLIFVVKIS